MHAPSTLQGILMEGRWKQRPFLFLQAADHAVSSEMAVVSRGQVNTSEWPRGHELPVFGTY
jgi:hypothetical protein